MAARLGGDRTTTLPTYIDGYIAQATAEMDRVYAMNPAMVREAAELTQVEAAKRLGSTQGVVSRTENRQDMYEDVEPVATAPGKESGVQNTSAAH